MEPQNVPLQSQPVESLPPQSQESSRNQRSFNFSLLLIIICFIFLFISLIGGYYFLKREANPSNTAKTTRWSTFRNKTYYYTLQFPSQFIMYSPLSTNSDDLLFFFYPNKKSPSLTFRIAAFGYFDKKMTLDEYLSQDQMAKITYKNAQKSSRTMGGRQGYLFYLQGENNFKKIYMYDVLIKKDDRVFSVTLTSNDDKLLKENNDLFNHVVDSFSFSQ